jgi:muconolactone delta-isomerase
VAEIPEVETLVRDLRASAGIDPRRPAASLTADELERLHAAMRSVLEEGIALRGTMTDLWGRPGDARHRRNVQDCSGQPHSALDAAMGCSTRRDECAALLRRMPSTV